MAISTRDGTETLFKFAAAQGFIMPKRYKTLYVIYGCLITGIGTYYFPLALTMSYFNLNLSEVEVSALLTSMQVMINTWGGLIKLMIVFYEWRRLRNCESVMAKLDARCCDADEVQELYILKNLGRKICIFFLSIYFIYSTSTFCTAVAMGRPPYSLYLPFIKWRRSNWELVAASLIEYSLIDLACLQQTINDGYAVIYICILRTHMKILLMRVSKLGSQKHWTSMQHIKELKFCITDHKNLLE